MNYTSILFRRNKCLYITKKENDLPKPIFATALRHLEKLGYTFSIELQEIIQTWGEQEFVLWFKELMTTIYDERGYNVKHVSFYRNFPNDVMELDEAELYLNSLLYYVFDIQPLQLVNKRAPLQIMNKDHLEVIKLAKEDDLINIVKRLIESNGSFTEEDKEDIELVLLNNTNPLSLIPETFLSKEKMNTVLSILYKNKKISEVELKKHFKTATDLLRFTIALSDGDVSLGTPSKFRSFKRSERRFLLSVLDNVPNALEEMIKRRNVWIRLGEKLHPGEYKDKFPHAAEVFRKTRNEKNIATFNSLIKKYIQDKKINDLTNEICKRPGEFARKLDYLLRSFSSSEDQTYLLSKFSSVSHRISTPVLLSLWNHFENRQNDKRKRTFFPKGNVSKLYTIDNTLSSLSIHVTNEIVEICKQTLSIRFTNKKPLGKVWIDEAYHNYTLPNGLRSASKSLRTIPRGSRLPIGEGDICRFFLYWKEGAVNGVETDTVDIDLSAVFYNNEFEYISDISYYDLKRKDLKCYHSGDFTSAKNGASEFIDCHIPTLKDRGIRYVVLSINSYSEHPFCNLPSCFAGWMLRKDFKTGEVFEPMTVVDRFDLASNQRISIPLIFDTFEREVIWCDLSLQNDIEHSNAAINNGKSLSLLVEAMTEKSTISLYDLLALHAKVRGTLVESELEADTVYSFDGEVTPYRYDVILSEFMS